MPAGVFAEVLMRAAAARLRRPDCRQPKSSVATPEGPPGGPMKAKLRAGSEDRRGAQPPHTAGGNTTSGETAHGETHPPTNSNSGASHTNNICQIMYLTTPATAQSASQSEPSARARQSQSLYSPPNTAQHDFPKHTYTIPIHNSRVLGYTSHTHTHTTPATALDV